MEPPRAYRYPQIYIFQKLLPIYTKVLLLQSEANMLHQGNGVSTLGFAVSDPIVESHLQLAVIADKCFLKMNFLTVIGKLLEVQQ
jgi:hypothetical protein